MSPRLPIPDLLLAPGVVDGLGQEAGVEVEADGGDLAVLFGPQEFAGAPDLQISHGDAEAGAQLFAALHHGGEATAGVEGQFFELVVEQIAVAPLGATPHPAPQLVELGQAKMVRPVDDHGVGVGDVQAVFDDGGADQHIHLAVGKAHHHLFQPPLGHLAVGHIHPHIGEQPLQPGGDGLDAPHPVVDKKGLAAPLQLPLDGLAHHHLVIFREDRVDGQPLPRRGVDGTHVADAGQAHVQGAGDGGGGEGEDIHLGAQLFELLFVAHAKALLFVDDQQPQILEGDVLAQQTVGADDQVHLAAEQALDHLLLLVGGAETAEHFDPNGEGGQTTAEGAMVLGGQDRGGDQHRHLFAVHDGLERGPHGHLGLAIAHVAADQPVHGPVQLHVHLHIHNGLELVLGLLIGEALLHLLLPGAVRAEGVACHQFPLGVEFQQIVGDVGHGLLGPLLDRGPIRRAKATDQGHGVPAHKAAQPVGLVDGNIELIPLGIADLEIFPLHPVQHQLDQPVIETDAMLHMDDKIPGLDIGKEQLRGHPAARGLALAGRRLVPAKEFGVGEQEQGLGIGDWGLGIGDRGSGTGDRGLSGLIPDPRSLIPDPQSPIPNPPQHKALAEDALEQGDAVGGAGGEVVLDVSGDLFVGQLFLQTGGLAGDQDGDVALVPLALHIGQDLFGLAAVAGTGDKATGQGRVGRLVLAHQIPQAEDDGSPR